MSVASHLTLRDRQIVVCLLLVVGLGIGTVILLPSRKRRPTPGELRVTLDHMVSLHAACERYRRVTGLWPQSLEALTNVIALKDPQVLYDGWGRRFVVMSASNVPGTIWLTSYGADGLPGGVGSNADFTETIH